MLWLGHHTESCASQTQAVDKWSLIASVGLICVAGGVETPVAVDGAPLPLRGAGRTLYGGCSRATAVPQPLNQLPTFKGTHFVLLLQHTYILTYIHSYTHTYIFGVCIWCVVDPGKGPACAASIRAHWTRSSTWRYSTGRTQARRQGEREGSAGEMLGRAHQSLQVAAASTHRKLDRSCKK